MKKWIFDTARNDLAILEHRIDLDNESALIDRDTSLFRERCAIEKLRLFILYVEKEVGVDD